MTPAAPSQPLPCEGMVEQTDGMIARYREDSGAVIDMLTRHRAKLATCRTHCWVRAQATGEAT